MSKTLIILDGRGLIHSEYSGVKTYTENIFFQLIKNNQNIDFVLWINAFKINYKSKFPNFKNLRIIKTRYPNKLLNLCFKLNIYFKIDTIISKHIKLNYKKKIYFSPDIRLYCFQEKVEVIQSVHDLSFIKYPKYFSMKTRLYFFLLNPLKLIANSCKIIVPTKTIKDELKSEGIKANKIKYIYEGGLSEIPNEIDNTNNNKEDLTSKQVNQYLKENNPYLIIIGTIEKRKNLFNLLSAIQIVQKKRDINILIIGEENNKVFKKTSIKYILRYIKNITFINKVNESEKRILIKNSRGLLYPSIYEGFGLPIVEAMQLNTSVLTSDLGAMKEISGDYSVLINPNSIINISEGIIRILNTEKNKDSNNYQNLYSWETAGDITSKYILEDLSHSREVNNKINNSPR